MILGLILMMNTNILLAQNTWEEDSELLANQVEYVAPVDVVFPNPANSQTTVVLNYIPIEKVYVDVVDHNGNVHFTQVYAPGGRYLNLDVSFLDRGFYVLRIRERTGLLQVVRLVKS